MMTTDTRDQLLRGILIDPRDTTRRLIFADWLEENGAQDRSEFIRVHCAGGKLPLRLSAQQLGWIEVPKNVHKFLFDPLLRCRIGRGFVDQVYCTCAEWQEYGPAICALQPVEELELVDANGESNNWMFGQAGSLGERSADEICRVILNWARGQAGLPPLKTQESPCTTSQT